MRSRSWRVRGGSHRMAAAAAVLLALGLAGCSAADSGGAPSSSESAAEGASVETQPVGAADIAFAQSMIPHHEQAVQMADMALDPDSGASPAVVALAEQIKAAQDPEIDQMTGWLQRWGAPTAMPGTGDGDDAGDMAGMDHSGHDMGGIAMSGMMTSQQMDDLLGSTGKAFDDMWVEMMIAHHDGAVLMAQQVSTQTADPEVRKLAVEIISAQKAEIATMRKMQS